MTKEALLRSFISFLGLVAVLILTTFASAEDKINIVPNSLSDGPLITTDDLGNVYVLHYGNDKVIYIFKNNRLVSTIKKEGASGEFLWLGFPEGKPSIIWRPKFSATGAKYIYFQGAEDQTMNFGKEFVVNNDKEALKPIDVAWEDEKIFISWVDERQQPTAIHMNYSTDGGKTFRKEDINMTPGYSAVLSKMIIGDNGLFFFFLGKKKDEIGDKKSGVIYARTSADGLQWSDIVPVAVLENWTPSSMEPVMTPDGPVLFWVGFEGIWYAYPDQDGKWHAQVIEGTSDMHVNRAAIKKDKTNNIYIAASYEKNEQKKIKPSVFFFSSNDNCKTWSAPLRINHNPYDNTSARFPDMYVAEDGTIVVVWEDHRFIRGNIYMNYSRDGGKTWLPEDINLDDNPGKNNDHYPFIVGNMDKVNVLIPRFKDDSLRGDLDLYLKEVKIGE